MREFLIYFISSLIAYYLVYAIYTLVIGPFFIPSVKVKVKLIPGGKLPVFKTLGAVCADAYAHLEKSVVIEHGERATIPLGFAMGLPTDYELQVRPRSGWSRDGVDVTLGTGDYDFIGEYTATICNNSHKPLTIADGDRVCQIGVRQVPRLRMKLVKVLKKTERGENGWGSTGRR